MSKERLKEADNWLLSMKEILSEKINEKEIEEVQQRIDLFEWLREQAEKYQKFDWVVEDLERQKELCFERVQELEGEIGTHAPHGRNYTNEQYVKLRLENKRYREALEFYGNKFNHMQTMDSFADGGRGPSLVMQDCGLKARKALSK